MNILNSNIGVVSGYIIVTEIPEAFNSQRNKLVNNFLCAVARNTKHSNNRGVVLAEIIHSVNMSYRYILNKLTCKCLVLVKNTYKAEASLFKRHMRGNCFAEITCAYKYCLSVIVHTENFTDFVVKLFNIVAVTLLTETAEAV